MVNMANRLRQILKHMLVWYGYYLPYHRGKWRVVNAGIRAFQMQAALATPVTVRRRGLWFTLDTRNYLDRSLYYLGTHEGKDTRFVEKMVRLDWVVCDVGANIGWYTLVAAVAMRGTGCVHAFEPALEDFRRLQQNVALNRLPSVVLHQTAMCDSLGTVCLAATRDAGTTQLATSRDESTRVVPVTTLDTFVRERRLDRLDLVKVDIEGSELRFLRGAQYSLQRFRPAMVIELNPNALAKFDATPQMVVDALEGLGYAMYRSKWRGLCRLEELPSPGRVFNAVALPRESVSGEMLSWKKVRDWAVGRTA